MTWSARIRIVLFVSAWIGAVHGQQVPGKDRKNHGGGVADLKEEIGTKRGVFERRDVGGHLHIVAVQLGAAATTKLENATMLAAASYTFMAPASTAGP